MIYENWILEKKIQYSFSFLLCFHLTREVTELLIVLVSSFLERHAQKTIMLNDIYIYIYIYIYLPVPYHLSATFPNNKYSYSIIHI